jgi:hypothetical protein
MLSTIDEEMTQRQRMLGAIDESKVDLSDEAISELLEIIMKVKSLNNCWFGRLAGLGKNWQAVLTARRSTLRKEMEADRT